MLKNIQISGHTTEESIKNVRRETKKAQIKAEIAKTEDKTIEKETTMKSLEEQKAELKKKNPGLLAKTKELAKGTKTATSTKAEEKGVTRMDRRETAEKILSKICKELKLAEPKRLNPMSTSKSGVGSFQAIGKAGGVKISVRSTDIVAYMPQSALGYGAQAPGRWVYVTILKAGDANLDKAFKKALMDPKSGATWAKELNFQSRGQSAPVDLDAKMKKLQEEIANLKKLQMAKKAEEKKEKKVIVKTPAVVAA
jgi:hypothetical protein